MTRGPGGGGGGGGDGTPHCGASPGAVVGEFTGTGTTAAAGPGVMAAAEVPALPLSCHPWLDVAACPSSCSSDHSTWAALAPAQRAPDQHQPVDRPSRCSTHAGRHAGHLLQLPFPVGNAGGSSTKKPRQGRPRTLNVGEAHPFHGASEASRVSAGNAEFDSAPALGAQPRLARPPMNSI